MCFCSLDNCEDVGDPISPLVFQVTHRTPPSGICAHVFVSNRCGCTSGRWKESRRVANANVDEYNEHSQDVHRLHLLATVNDQIEQVLLMEPMVTYRTQVPHSKSASQVKKPYNKSNQFRQVVELKSTFTKPLGSMEKARRNVEWTTARGMNTFPFRHWVMKGNTSAQIDRNSKKKH